MTTERGGSIPFVGVFDIHVDLVSMPLEKKYIIHSLSPLESGTNHCPVILVVIDHVLYFLKVRSRLQRKEAAYLIMAADRENAEEISIFCSCATFTMCSAADHQERWTAYASCFKKNRTIEIMFLSIFSFDSICWRSHSIASSSDEHSLNATPSTVDKITQQNARNKNEKHFLISKWY